MLPSPTVRLLLSMILFWVIGDLGCELAIRIFDHHPNQIHAPFTPSIAARRVAVNRLANGRRIAIANEEEGAAILLGVVRDSSDPQFRDRASELLVFLARDDWPDDHRRAFLEHIATPALSSARVRGIPPSIILAQAILESGWGRSRLAQSHHNLFGVKATSGQSMVRLPTLEHGPKGVHITRAKFRTFSDDEASIKHHGALLAEDPRYAHALPMRGDWGDYIAEIAPIYASDPRYVRRITQLVESYGLDRWDRGVFRSVATNA